MKQNKQFFRRLLAVAFWLAVWQAAAMAIGQEVFLVSPVQALRTLVQLLPRADFWQRVCFSSGRILLGFLLGAVVSVALAICAARWSAADALLAPVMQLVKATPVASFIILALVWVRGSALSVLISLLMVLPVLYGAVRTGIAGADVQLLEMAAVKKDDVTVSEEDHWVMLSTLDYADEKNDNGTPSMLLLKLETSTT